MARTKNRKAKTMNMDVGLRSRAKTSAETRRAMILNLIRLETAYHRVQRVLTVERLSEYPDFALIWVLLQDHFKKSDVAPQRSTLLAAAHDALPCESHEMMVGASSDNVRQTICDAFKLRIYDNEKVELANWTVRTVVAFLEEQLLTDFSSVTSCQAWVPEDPHAVLTELTAQINQLKVLQRPAIEDKLFPDNWKPAGLALRPTGIPFVDKLIEGGAAAGEILGVLGGYGSCKSTLGNMIVVEAAKNELRRMRKPNYDSKTKLAFLFFWESAYENDFRFRALSYWAEIKLDRLRSMRGWDSLGVRERGRAKEVIRLLNKWTYYSDMSGADGTSFNRGTEGVEEIVRTIESKLEDRKMNGVSTVIIDYAGIMVDRFLVAHDISEDAFRHHLRRLVWELKTQVACRFKCDVWLLHQLNTEANSRTVGGVARRTDAAECKAFAEHLDFCFPIGLPTQEGLCIFSCDKHRRTDAHNPEIIQIQGDLSRVVSTDGAYVIDPATFKIVAIEDLCEIRPALRPRKKESKRTLVIE